MTYYVLKFLHVVGAAVLLGTGAGIAFFMLMAHLTGRPQVIAAVARIVVLADAVFTAAAVVAQPITGLLLAWTVGHPLGQFWLIASIGLYILTGACWLPVVVIQIRLRDLAQKAAREDAPLPADYHRLFRWWFALGVPAFAAVLGIVWLMTLRPQGL